MARAHFAFGYWAPRHFAGWYWANHSHGHRVYRGVGGLANVDFDMAVGFAQADATSIPLVGLGHEASTRYTYVLRPVCGNGWLETPDVSNSCEFETDGSGDWLGSRPTGVEWLAADVEDGGDIKLSWSWRRSQGESAPNDFGLYYATSPTITAGSPDATESFSSEGRYSHTFSLTGGQTYWFAVTARTSGGVESPLSKIIGPYVADDTAPGAPIVSLSTRF